jgi:hypothetical protein
VFGDLQLTFMACSCRHFSSGILGRQDYSRKLPGSG